MIERDCRTDGKKMGKRSMAIDRNGHWIHVHARSDNRLLWGPGSERYRTGCDPILGVASFPKFYRRPRRHFVIDDDDYRYYHYISRGRIHAPVNCNSATTSVGHFHYDSLFSQRPQCRHRSAKLNFMNILTAHSPLDEGGKKYFDSDCQWDSISEIGRPMTTGALFNSN